MEGEPATLARLRLISWRLAKPPEVALARKRAAIMPSFGCLARHSDDGFPQEKSDGRSPAFLILTIWRGFRS